MFEHPACSRSLYGMLAACTACSRSLFCLFSQSVRHVGSLYSGLVCAPLNERPTHPTSQCCDSQQCIRMFSDWARAPLSDNLWKCGHGGGGVDPKPGGTLRALGNASWQSRSAKSTFERPRSGSQSHRARNKGKKKLGRQEAEREERWNQGEEKQEGEKEV